MGKFIFFLFTLMGLMSCSMHEYTKSPVQEISNAKVVITPDAPDKCTDYIQIHEYTPKDNNVELKCSIYSRSRSVIAEGNQDLKPFLNIKFKDSKYEVRAKSQDFSFSVDTPPDKNSSQECHIEVWKEGKDKTGIINIEFEEQSE